MDTPAETCFACGGVFPNCDGPTHRYMASTPGCWANYTAILAREYSDAAYFAAHQFTVDAYAVQHPGGKDAQSIQSVTTHLIRLCLMLENGFDGARANEHMMSARKKAQPFMWLAPPSAGYAMTAADLIEVDSAQSHCKTARDWARSVWATWEAHHEIVRGWIASWHNGF